MDIKSVLKKYGETTYTLAEKMGISQPSMHSIVNGNPTVRKLEQVAKALGCSPAEFFSDWKEDTYGSENKSGLGEAEGAGDLPFKDDEAEQVQAVRFSYQCPRCGEKMFVCISPGKKK